MTEEPEQSPGSGHLSSSRKPWRNRTLLPFASISLLGIGLAIGFSPMMFDQFTTYDDEGFFLAILRRFVDHGHLYVDTKTAYGPFYFSFMGALYRLTGQTPTLFNGRLIVLILTALASGVFAATVWRVTRSLAFSVLCEVVTFSLLMRVAWVEPMHPGSLIVLVVSVLMYSLASYAMHQRTAALVGVGATAGALLMTKINVGLFAATAVVVVLVVGNREFSTRFRTIVATAALLMPVALISQRLWQVFTVEFAFLVVLSLLLVYVPMHLDVVSLPRNALVVAVVGALTAIAASVAVPLLSGTSPSALITGVFVRPLRQVDVLSAIRGVSLEWPAFVITIGVVGLAMARREDRDGGELGPSWLPHAALAIAGLWVLGLGVLGVFLAWLPAIALLPALAWISIAAPKERLVLRLLVPVAILQMLHAYPVSTGSQRVWGLVAMCVPCVIAMALGSERLVIWRQAGRGARAIAVGVLCAVLLVASSAWPPTAWHDYNANTPLALPGARYVRLNPSLAVTIQRLTRVVKKRCDTFYSAPGFNSLYIFTGLPTPTNFLQHWPGALTTNEQEELAKRLADVDAREHLCIVRDLLREKEWLSGYGRGPLGKALGGYRLLLAEVGRYSVSVRGTAAPKDS